MKVAIAGYGQEGETNLIYYRALSAEVAVFDEKTPELEIPRGIESYFGKDAFSKLKGFGLVVRTPSLSPNKITTDGKIWTATNEFFEKCPAPIIGVTGTKGKGTTCSLITEILKNSGKTVHLVGNIGVPALERLSKITPDDIVVYELSSFQLWDLEKSPETAVVLMIEPDHMDIHASMEEYVAAKGHITQFQTSANLVIYHPSNSYSAEVANKSPGNKLKCLTHEGAYVKAGNIYIQDQHICSTGEAGIVGAHNLENVCAAITTAWQYTQDIPAIKQAVTGFKGLPHRLEFVRELDGVKFYDDSIATNEGSVLAAIKAFEQPKIVIMGGAGKGASQRHLFEQLPEKKIKKIILLGEKSEEFAGFAKANNLNFEIIEGDMDEIVSAANDSAEEGDVVLLSPAATSYDMFRNYKERGDTFKAAVNKL